LKGEGREGVGWGPLRKFNASQNLDLFWTKAAIYFGPSRVST
jgi:hypothetical protein